MKKSTFFLPLALALAAAGGARAQTPLPCTAPIASFPYVENFESGPGGWISGGTASSWALGTPAKPVIQGAASGSNAWVTGLGSAYANSESSQVTSPCFDFSSLTQPRISFKIWWNAENSFDGAVLQSSIDGGVSWQTIGAAGDPDNWYNSSSISGQPGGQRSGWTGRGTGTNPGSGGYVLAKHNLPNLAGQANVRLRVAFASDGSVTDDGFAFDDITLDQPAATDVGVAAITSPSNGSSCAQGPQTVTIRVQNFGSAAQSNIPVSYSINGGAPVTTTVPGPLAAGATVSFSFPGTFTPAAGANVVTATTNLAGDANPANNAAPNAVTVSFIQAVATFPYNQDFESGAGGWTSGGTNNSWVLGYPSKNTIVGTSSGVNAWVTGIAGPYSNSEQGFVVSPCFDFSSLTQPRVALSIWWQADVGDGAALQSSIDGGATWQTVGALGDPDNWYNSGTITGQPGGQRSGWTGPSTTSTPPTSGGYVRARHLLTGLAGQGNVRLRVVFASDGFTAGDGIAFDDFTIDQPAAADVGVSAITSPAPGTSCAQGAQTVTITVRNFGSAAQSNIPVSYRINGGTPLTATVPGPVAPGTTVSFTFPGTFTPVAGANVVTATTALTGDADATNDAAPGSVTVSFIQPIATYPYNQDFENGTGGWISGGTDASWALGTPAKTTIQGAASGSNAWVTGLTPPYNNDEDSYVLSPCLDFTTLSLPTIEFNIWWNSENNFDGAALQSSIDGGATWQTVGAAGDPDNWYNSSTISGQPGGQRSGWTGRGTGTNPGSGAYVLARHEMPTLARRANVRLRVVFGADGSVTDDGFAFDDVRIFSGVGPPAPAANDVSVRAILDPAPACSLTSSESVSVLVANLGTQAQRNIPLTVQYTTPAGTVRTLSATLAGPLLPGLSNQARVVFSPLQNLSVRGCYAFKAYATLAADEVRANDTARLDLANLLINQFPYQETFDNGACNGWSGSGTWTLGNPQKAVIQGAASGTNAWVTGGLGTTPHAATENSAVVSPCFDLSALTAPVIQMKVWWNAEKDRDGAALQYSIDNGGSWQTLGSQNDPTYPTNWYNSSTIVAAPGGSGQGWTGSVLTGGTEAGGYVLVSHDLAGTPVVGQTSVRFRVVFTATAATPLSATDSDDGFAFDDVLVFNRPANDLAIVGLVLNPGTCGFGSAEQVSVRLKNFGNQASTPFPASYTINGGAPVSTTINPVIQPGDEAVIALGNLDLSTPITGLTVNITPTPDAIAANNTLTTTIVNARRNVVAFTPIDFQTAATSLNRLTTQAGSLATVGLQSGRGTANSVALLLSGNGGTWTAPSSTGTGADVWNLNGNHLASAAICLDPSNASLTAPFRVLFDLRQVSSGAGAVFTNTNLRVLINGVQVGPTYRPPATNPGSTVFRTDSIDLTPYRTGGRITITFQSNVNRAFVNGSGDANFLDNIRIRATPIVLGLPVTADGAFAQGISVYPNPSTGIFRVALNRAGTYTLTVTDLSGRRIRSQQVKGSGTTEAELDLTSLARGLYVLRVTDAEGHQTSRKLTLE